MTAATLLPQSPDHGVDHGGGCAAPTVHVNDDMNFFTYLSNRWDNILELGLEHPDHRLLDVLEQLVDDLVGADLDVGAGGQASSPSR